MQRRSPRCSSDSIALWQAALVPGWSTTRVRQIGDSAEPVGEADPAEAMIDGETILANAVTAALDLALGPAGTKSGGSSGPVRD